MEQHFVEFLSPGTFFSESSEKQIDSWDVKKAKKFAKNITERYGAKPYGFRFKTRSRTDADLDSKVTAVSGMYYLGGDILSYDDVKNRNDPKDDILLSNMRNNRYKFIIENRNSYLFTGAFDPDKDKVV